MATARARKSQQGLTFNYERAIVFALLSNDLLLHRDRHSQNDSRARHKYGSKVVGDRVLAVDSRVRVSRLHVRDSRGKKNYQLQWTLLFEAFKNTPLCAMSTALTITTSTTETCSTLDVCSVAQDLDQIHCPVIAEAAAFSVFVTKPIPFPLGCEILEPSDGTYVVARAKETSILQNSHKECNLAVTLPNSVPAEEGVRELLNSEQTEFVHALKRRPPVDSSLPPRRMGVCVLCFEPLSKKALSTLLDAVSFIASEGVAADGGRGAAQTTRITFLAGESARSYAISTKPCSTKKHCSMKRGSAEVGVLWADEDEDGDCIIRAEFTPITVSVSVHATVNEIQNSVLGMCAEFGIAPPGQWTVPYEKCESGDIYVQRMESIANEFASIMKSDSVFQRSRHLATVEKTRGVLNFDNQLYVRIVPFACGNEMHHSRSFCGALLHETGKHAQALRYCQDAISEEREKDPEAPCYGITPPVTFADQEIGLHVMYAHAQEFNMETSVTTYYSRASPGQRLHPTRGSCIWRISKEIRPLETVLGNCRVIPCTKTSCYPAVPMMRIPYMELLEEVSIDFGEVLEETGKSPCKRRRVIQNGSEGETSPEDAFALNAFGLGLGSTSTKVGEAYTEMQSRLAPAEFARFFLTLCNQYGKESSVVLAVQKATHDLDHQKETMHKAIKEAESLKNELLEMKAANEEHMESTTGVNLTAEANGRLLAACKIKVGRSCLVRNGAQKTLGVVHACFCSSTGIKDIPIPSVSTESDTWYKTETVAVQAQHACDSKADDNGRIKVFIMRRREKFDFYTVLDGAVARCNPVDMISSKRIALVSYSEVSKKITYYVQAQE